QITAAIKDEELESSAKATGDTTPRQNVLSTEQPRHRVVLTKPFRMSVTEVTVGQFKKFAAAVGYQSKAEKTGEKNHYANPGQTVADDSPAAFMTWEDAQAYCRWLSAQEQAIYRLPTEAEWEYACRAGTTTQFSCGDDFNELKKYAWFRTVKSNPVATRLANPFGLFDMHGNLHEWCQDYWNPRWYGQSIAVDPTGPELGTERVVRGGNWLNPALYCRSAKRFSSPPGSNYRHYGFRVVREVDTLAKTAAATSPVVIPLPTIKPFDPAPSSAKAPFDSKQARAHQEAWAKHLGVPVEYTNPIGMKFVLIPPGEFLMGSTPAEIEEALKFAGEDKHLQECIKSEAPQHKVILTQPSYLGVHEVTQAQYEQVMGKNPSNFARTGPDKAYVEKVAGMNTTSHPVEGVSWNDAAEFCAKLSQQEKLKPFYFRTGQTVTPLDGTGYRLPSEAEWELACRAGTTTKYWIGDKDEELMRAGWFGANSGGRTHPVGELKGNPFGLYDIHGNVWEWVQDGWEATYYGQFQDMVAINPDAPFSAGSARVIRGGSWFFPASFCRASFHHDAVPWGGGLSNGFRVSLVVHAVKAAIAERKTSPEFQQWMKDVAAQPADKQVDAVAKKLQELNPDFDGKVTHTIKNGEVFELSLFVEHVSDISPVRALTQLKGFSCNSSSRGQLANLSPLQGLPLTAITIENTPVSDLSALKGMPLTSVSCGATRVSDLSPLQGMPLTVLTLYGTSVTDISVVKEMKLKRINFGGSRVSDLSVLQGMPLTGVNCNGTPVSDLSPLRGMALTSMDCQNTKVTDLTPLIGMPLKDLHCDFIPARDTEILRSFKTLEKINYKPAAEFWKNVESPPPVKKP
ncbi:MAG: SUMF1/EgtB/PvdO family nonheme iron enzyme, partial [Planctomycetaceae bacterium]|nr:SUMF1/EgtB/PvdO family nonheme iron enzyme [Planctomycetaceae bacterium]